jgi:hypothetical protein
MFNDKYLQIYPMSLPSRFNSPRHVYFGISYRRTSFSCQRDPVGVQRRNRFVQANGHECQKGQADKQFCREGNEISLLLARHYGF